ncbi:MAG: stage II sporulation protein M [Gracilibacteraceae bacterium]|jgi:stage II sporulation protein M|nr:stage II sporulation protein M [Gracilibacteraceae bacterium]
MMPVRQFLRLWRERAAGHFWAACLVFAALFAFGAGLAAAHPDSTKDIIELVAQNFAAKGLLEAEAPMQAWIIFSNNLTVCFLLLVFGLIPFLFLPHFIIAMNGFAVGVVIAAAPLPTGSRVLFAAAGLLPHGIFELPALFIAASLGSFCCARLTGALLGKSKPAEGEGEEKNRWGPRQTALFAAKTFLLFILPLLIIAAIAEIWLTPLALKAIL